jgi:predicted nuclease of predicted toxin-antitoxin system
VKLLLDQHLSRKLIPVLEGSFPCSAQVALLGLEESDDDAVWAFARERGFAIVTKDEDFQVLSFSRGHPPKVVWLRSGNGPTSQLAALRVKHGQSILEFGLDPDRSLLTLP